MVRLFFSIIIPLFIGYNIILIIFRKNLKELMGLEQAALSYITGLSILGLEMFVLSFFGIDWSFRNMASPWIVITLINVAWITMGGFAVSFKTDGKPVLGLIEKIFLGLIIFQIIFVTLKALALPIEAPDAVAIYAIKAKAFYLKGGIDRGILTDVSYKDSHQDYPLLLPLAECFVYRVFGFLNDHLVKIIFPLYFSSAIAIFYFILRRFIERRGSILLAFMLSSVPQFAAFGTNGYADLLISCYYTAALLYLFVWMKERKPCYLMISALMSFSAIWTKNEGWMLFLVNAVVLTLFLMKDKAAVTKKVFIFAGYAAGVIMLILPFVIFKNRLGLESDIISRDTLTPARMLGNIDRLGPIFYEYQKHLFGPKRWNLAWLAVLSVFILKAKEIFKDEKAYLALAIILCLTGYTAIYIITPHGLGWHLSTSASRLLLHFLPVGLFLFALSFKKELDAF
jgi:hypothetical protein